MDNNIYFSLQESRSERALQVEKLVPALKDLSTRRELLSKIDVKDSKPILPTESDQAQVMHFVWVLRDTFSCERDLASKTKAWSGLRSRWSYILDLPEWARDPIWWRHPNKEYKHRGDPEYIVHPCQRAIGWTESAIRERARHFSTTSLPQDYLDKLVAARTVMNTECDCIIQTPKRLIVIECKDKTNFQSEQQHRQEQLLQCLDRLLSRPQPHLYVEIAPGKAKRRPNQWWSWDMLTRVKG